MCNPCVSFVVIMARMGRLGSSGRIGISIVSSGFENILRKTASTSSIVCVMSTFTYTRRPCSVMWLPEIALNTGKCRNPNVARSQRRHRPLFGGCALRGCEQGGAFTGGCAAVNPSYGLMGHGRRGPSILLAKHPRRAKPGGGSECHLPGGGSPNGSRFESDCTLEKRHLGVNHGKRGIQNERSSGPRSNRIKSAIPSANGRRAAKHEHGRNDDGKKSTAVCCSRKNGYGKGWRDDVAQLGPAGQRVQKFKGPRANWSKSSRVQGPTGPTVQGSKGPRVQSSRVQGPTGPKVQGSRGPRV